MLASGLFSRHGKNRSDCKETKILRNDCDSLAFFHEYCNSNTIMNSKLPTQNSKLALNSQLSTLNQKWTSKR